MGRHKAKWDREAVLIWIVSRDRELAQNAGRRVDTSRKHPLSAIYLAIVELGLKTNYRRDRRRPDPARFRLAFDEAAKELEHSTLPPDANGLFDRDSVIALWPAERRLWEKGHYTNSIRLERLIVLVLTKTPMDWAGIKADLDIDDNESTSEADSDDKARPRLVSSALKAELSAAIRFAFRCNWAERRAEVIDRKEYDKRLKNIWAWRKRAQGGAAFHAEVANLPRKLSR